MFSWLYPIVLMQAALAESPPPPMETSTGAPCSGEEHAAFNFWVGEWDVYPTGSDNQVGESKIESVSNGCVVREHWMPLTGGDGTSMSFINHKTGRWEQVWMGSDGARVDFTGGMVGTDMVLTGYWEGIGPDGADVLVRMTYSAAADGSVRQRGEGSTDHGQTWQGFFDLTYRPKQDSSE